MSSQTAFRAKASRLTTTRLSQGILTVSEVMPKVVAILPGHVEGFVFFFPSCACVLDKFEDVVGGDGWGGLMIKVLWKVTVPWA